MRLRVSAGGLVLRSAAGGLPFAAQRIEALSVATPTDGAAGAAASLAGAYNGPALSQLEYYYSTAAGAPAGGSWQSTPVTLTNGLYTSPPVPRPLAAGTYTLFTRLPQAPAVIARSGRPFTVTAGSVPSNAPTASWGQLNLRVTEGAAAQLTILRIGNTAGDLTVNYQVIADTAVPGTNYVAVNFPNDLRSVVIPSGQDRVTVSIQTLNTAVVETTKRIALEITGVVYGGAAGLPGVPRTCSVSIYDAIAPEADYAPISASPYDLTNSPVLTGLIFPTRFHYIPDAPGNPGSINGKRVILCEKRGTIKIGRIDNADPVVNNATLTTLLDLSTITSNYDDHGLLDAIFHPDLFAGKPFLYVFTVVDPPNLPVNLRDQPGSRFSWVMRFQVDISNPAALSIVGGASAYTVILGTAGQVAEDITGNGTGYPATSSTQSSERKVRGAAYELVVNGLKQDFLVGDSPSHNGGALIWSREGSPQRLVLYVMIGDASAPTGLDYRITDVQDLDSYRGKVLRIDPDTGDGLPDNPFYASAVSIATNTLGNAALAPKLNRARLWQLGLRNPFSGAVDNNGQLYIENVGANTWESFHIGAPGANFGWPFYEGGDYLGGLSQYGLYRDNINFAFTAVDQACANAADFYAKVSAGTIRITLPFRAFPHPGTFSAPPNFTAQAIVGGQIIEQTPNFPYPPEVAGRFIAGDWNSGQLWTIDVTSGNRFVTYLGKTSTESGNDNPGATSMYQNPVDGFVYYAKVIQDYSPAGLINGSINKLGITALPARKFVTAGAAVRTADGLTAGVPEEYLLTPAAANRVGIAAHTTRIDLRQSFDISFDLKFSQDGLYGAAIALHNHPGGPRAYIEGAVGPGWGYVGDAPMPGCFLAVLNTFGGNFAQTTGRNQNRAIVGNTSVSLPAPIEDNAWHTMRVTWTPPVAPATTGTVRVFVDGVQRTTVAINLINAIFSGSNFAYFVLSASTDATFHAVSVRPGPINATYEP